MRASGRSSGRVEPVRSLPAGMRPSCNDSFTPTYSFMRADQRATAVYVAGLIDQLSGRDVAILRDLGRVRALTGRQLERLHFHDLGQTNRDRARRRVLNRLTSLSLVTTLARRVGGVRAGSGGLVYALDVAGQRLLRLLDHEREGSARRPWTPGALFLAHTLAVAELYVCLREAERTDQLELSGFLAEPACWQRTASLGTIKPDAYALLALNDIEDAWWVEVDRGTEGRGTLRRKLSLYVLAAQAGVVGLHDVLPRVLVTVPDESRLDVVRGVIVKLAPTAERLISVTVHNQAIEFMAQTLHE